MSDQLPIWSDIMSDHIGSPYIHHWFHTFIMGGSVPMNTGHTVPSPYTLTSTMYNTSPGIYITSSNVTSSSHGSMHTNTHALTHQSHTAPHTSASISEAIQIHTMHLHLASMSKCTQYSTHRSLPQPTHITTIHITNKTLH